MSQAVDLTGNVGHSVGDVEDGDEYMSSSSAEEEKVQEDESQTLSTLSEEANFLLGRVSKFGRDGKQSQACVLMKYWNKRTLSSCEGKKSYAVSERANRESGIAIPQTRKTT